MTSRFVWILEAWKDVPGYEGLYKVSTGGNVRSLITNKILKEGLNNRGYLSVKLYKDKSKSTVAIHRLVAKTFKINLENKPDVNHKNGIKTDNRLVNLEWVTEKENIRHAIDTGLMKSKKGFDSPFSIFNKEDIENIKYLHFKGTSVSDIAKKYNCSLTTIYDKLKLKGDL